MEENKNYTYIPASAKKFSVDIVMLAYNHEKFISMAIESVLMQKTQFPYRIIIGEDSSTDHTRRIIKKYHEKYPDKISLILWNHNVGGEKNHGKLMEYCSSKYIAYLEGDDYWTDPLKLEKQILYMENNPNYIGTAHNVRCVDADGKLLHRDFNLYPIQEEHIYGSEQAFRYELISQTASIVYRNVWANWTSKDWKAFSECKANGDQKLSIILGLKGDIYFFRDIMADHRRIFEGESWTAQTYQKNKLWFAYMSRLEIRKYFEYAMGISLPIDQYRKYLTETCIEKIFRKMDRTSMKIAWKLSVEKYLEKIR